MDLAGAAVFYRDRVGLRRLARWPDASSPVAGSTTSCGTRKGIS
jgi:hypothetical protein